MIAEVDFDKRVSQYLALRNKIAVMKEEFEAKLEPFGKALVQLNGMLLEHLNTVGGESVRTASGTVYRSIKKSASLADPDAFMKFVIDNHQWELLDRKANVTAVEDFLAEHHNPPPGVNFSQVFQANVRRAPKAKDL